MVRENTSSSRTPRRAGGPWLWALALLTGVLLAPHALRRLGAGWNSTHASAVREHREHAAKRDTSQFLKDWSNLVEGRVVDATGSPVAGASVEIFAKQRLLALQVDAPPVAEAEVMTGADGGFVVAGLDYGSKYVRARVDGHLEHVLEDIVSLDGVGAQGLTLSLEPAAEWGVVLESEDGSPIANQRVVIVPEGLLEPPVEAHSDAGGRVELPARLRGLAGSGVWLLVGAPAATFRVDRSMERIQVPPLLPLNIRLLGASPEQPVSLTLAPQESTRLGALKLEAALTNRDGVILISDVHAGNYLLAVEQGERVSWLEFHHDGSPQECRLSGPSEILVSFRTGDGKPLNESVRWRWQPSEPSDLRSAAADRKSFADQFDPLMRQGTLQPGAELLLERLPLAGWLSVMSSGSKLGLFALGHEQRDQTLVLEGERVSVLARLPYLPVHVRTSEGWTATFEANAFGEIAVRLPSGPTVVRVRFSRGIGSYPKGVWSGLGGDPIRFGLVDAERGGAGATVFGFVHAGKVPVAEAEVFLSGGRRAKKVTSEHGFFRFEGVGSSFASVSARRADDEDAVLWPTRVELEGPNSESRLDLELWDGSMEIQNCPPGLEGLFVTLCFRESVPSDLEIVGDWLPNLNLSPQHASARGQSRVTQGSARFSGLRPGYYELWFAPGSEEARPLKRFTLTRDEQLSLTMSDQ